MIVRWSESAVEYLARIYEFLYPRSPRAAAPTLDGVVSRALQIADFPESGCCVEGSRYAATFEVLAPPYRIVYEMHANFAEVVAVRDGRQLR